MSIMENSQLRFNPFGRMPLRAEASNIGELIVKTSSIQYAEKEYVPKLFNKNPPSLLIIGERGSGKTTLMYYLRSQLQNYPLKKKILPLHLAMSAYDISSKQDFGSAFYSNLLLSTIDSLARYDKHDNHKYVRKIHHILSLKYLKGSNITAELEEMIKERLNDLSSNFEILLIFIDDFDKYVPEIYEDAISYLNEYQETYKRTLVQYANSIGLKLAFVMASSPDQYNVVFTILNKMKKSEIISIPLYWDLGYLYDLVRKRLLISSISQRPKVDDFFNDEAIFKLFLACQKNPRLFQILCQRSMDIAMALKSLPISESLAVRVIAESQRIEPFWYKQNKQFVIKYKQLLKEVKQSKSNVEKGKSLERLARHIFEAIDGIFVKEKRKLTWSGELDIFLKNDRDDGVWKHLGDLILVECKNLNKPTGINILKELIESVRGGRIKTGILFSTKGISGDKTKYARKKIREAFLNGIYILDFDMKDLERIFDPKDFENMLDDKRINLHMDVD